MVTRAEHRRRTLLRLSEAAVDLFAAEGASVTIDAVATRAGVARRTVFRYVDSKEELAFIHPLLWFDVFDHGLDQAPVEPLSERIRIASRAIALHIDADPEPPRKAFRVVAEHPELGRGFNPVYQRWIDRVAAEVLTVSADPADPTAQFQARIIGAAVMGMVDAVIRQWVSSPEEVRFVDLYDEGYPLLATLLEAGVMAPG